MNELIPHEDWKAAWALVKEAMPDAAMGARLPKFCELLDWSMRDLLYNAGPYGSHGDGCLQPFVAALEK
jgi:hypothetical protein